MSKEGAGIFLLFRGTLPSCWAAHQATQVCRCPQEAREPEGGRDQAPSLLSAALLIFTCISVPSPGRLHCKHVTLGQWRDLIPISARPPGPLCVHTVGRRCLLRPGLQPRTGPGGGLGIEGDAPLIAPCAGTQSRRAFGGGWARGQQLGGGQGWEWGHRRV